jgi:hypothetical protein
MDHMDHTAKMVNFGISYFEKFPNGFENGFMDVLTN